MADKKGKTASNQPVKKVIKKGRTVCPSDPGINGRADISIISTP